MPPRVSSTSGAEGAAGFTLTELVIVIAMLGILASVGVVRYFDTTSFQEDFFVEDVRGALGWARKLAVASGCEVQVTIGGGGYELRQRPGCTGGGFSVPVSHPTTGTPGYASSAPTGVSLSSNVSPIVFDGLGRARNSGGAVVDVTISVGGRTLNTVGETGFVHAPGA
jgi:MSHA pilin protein MshC